MGGGSRGGRPSYAGGGGGGGAYRGDLNKYMSYSPAIRAFISFHMDDEAQVDLLRHQARSDQFDLEFTDYSVKEPFDERWKTQCTERIRQSSVVIVMIGPETHTRPAVLWEINKAYELGKPVIGVRIYRNARHQVPDQMVFNEARVVNWNMQEIQQAMEEER